jgi:hypothetical protein
MDCLPAHQPRPALQNAKSMLEPQNVYPTTPTTRSRAAVSAICIEH